MVNKSRGKITVGEEGQKKQLEIIDFVQAQFKDNRLIAIAGIEDGTLVLSIENPLSTGRSGQTNIWLSKESALGLMSTCFLYFGCKGENIEKLFMDSVANNDLIDFTCSDNLNNNHDFGG
jgi:hypothetical protein